MTWLQLEYLTLLRASFPSGSRLLEISCGAGEEALALAQAGDTVLATNVSPRMTTLTQARAVEAGMEGRVEVAAVSVGLLGSLPLTRQPFDGGYSNFGALNHEPDLPAAGAALARLIRPGGSCIIAVMGRICLFEMAWQLLQLQPRLAFQRSNAGWQQLPVIGHHGCTSAMPVRFLTVRQVTEAFPTFRLERILALPLFMPSPAAANLLHRYPRLIRFLERADRKLRERAPWRTLGGHMVLALRRRY